MFSESPLVRLVRQSLLLSWLVIAISAFSMSASLGQTCTGDCDGNCFVGINELIRGVGISLGSQDVATCQALDTDGNGQVSISELIQAVNRALNGCGPCDPNDTPSPTPSAVDASPTSTPTATSSVPGTETPDPSPTSGGGTETPTTDPTATQTMGTSPTATSVPVTSPTSTPAAQTQTPATPTPGMVTPGPSTTVTPPTPTGGLAVLGANGTDNTTVLVTFNGAIDDATGLDPGSYEIVQKERPEAGGPEIFEVRFLVTCDGGSRNGRPCNDRSDSADMLEEELCPGGGTCSIEDRSRVVVTTGPHAMLVYRITVTGVRDTAGSTIQVFGPRGDIRNQREYTGEPVETIRHCVQATVATTLETGRCDVQKCVTSDDCPQGDSCVDRLLDCDGDGLTDDVEARGWIVRVRRGGSVEESLVTSNPFKVDTDGDGLADDEERLANLTGSTSDPRQKDTDQDGVDDFAEVKLLRTDPSDTDTDEDGLSDGVEMAMGYSPRDDDTDGDSIPDIDDFGTGDPRIADLPSFAISLGDTQVTLDYEWSFTSEERTLDSISSSESATVTRGSSQTSQRLDTTASEWFVKVAAKATLSAGPPDPNPLPNPGPPKPTKLKDYFEGEASVTAEAGIGIKDTSTTTRESTETSSRNHARTRESGQQLLSSESQMRQVTGATISNEVTFTNTGSLDMRLLNVVVAVRTADPSDPTEYVTIGELSPPAGLTDPIELGSAVSTTKGPFLFSNTELDIRGSDFIDAVMANPRSLIFEVVNVNVETPIPGTAPTEFTPFFAKEQSIIGNTSQITIDYGGVGGRNSQRFFVSANLGTMRVVRDTNDDNVPDPERVYFDGTELLRPTLAEALAVTGVPFELNLEDGSIRSVGGVAADDPERNEWIVIVEDNPGTTGDFGSASFDPELAVSDIVMVPGRQVWIAYAQDFDQDGIPLRAEIFFGTSDEMEDTDEDGVPDVDEVFRSYEVTVETVEGGSTTYEARSHPLLADSDGDGIDDAQERLVLGTAADRADSDGDLVPDGLETGATSPLDADSNDDGTRDLPPEVL